MNANEIISVILTILISIILSYPLGWYMAKVFKGEKTFLDFLSPIENGILKICKIDKNSNMKWKEYLFALLSISLVWFIVFIVMLLLQSFHPFWNPNNITSFEPTLAFNTAVSFVTNTNLQHYAGETGASFFSQTIIFTFLQFVTAGSGIAVMALFFRLLHKDTKDNLGNFYVDLLHITIRILLPLSIIVAVILLINGVPVNFNKTIEITTLEGHTQLVSQGPVAPMVAIKQLGTNGGGFFGVNSSHSFENPNFIANMIENVCILLIPMACVFAFGFFLNKKKFALIIFSIMLLILLMLLIPTIIIESNGSSALANIGISQPNGNMEGKEVRFGSSASALWGISTTNTSNGSVNSMHDSFNPLSGLLLLLGMMFNSSFGGVGVGLMSMFIFIIITIFIAGLMVGRTPELLGRKIEAKEVKIAMIIVLIHGLFIIGGTALSSYLYTSGISESSGWLKNQDYHGFSTMLYEFTSASQNNGSGFEGLGDNTPFWNIATGLIMLFSRYIPIIGTIAIAGSLYTKKQTPESSGTLKEDSITFGIILFGVIIIVGGLLFFPSLVLGPISEYLMGVK